MNGRWLTQTALVAIAVAVTVLAVLIGTQRVLAPQSINPAAVAVAAPALARPASPGAATDLSINLAISKPANGTHFLAGQAPVVSMTLGDGLGRPLAKSDFATLNLYLYGPQDPAQTKTAARLLNASTDRSKPVHHYVDLLQAPDTQLNGHVLTYRLKPVGDEAAGTYTAAVWAVRKDAPLQQTMQLVDLQIGTPTAEKQVVDKDKCAACHLGTSSGKFYLHHVDPGRTPEGNWALDSDPVRTCKACHNNDGYAAYAGDISNPQAGRDTRTPDPIVRRVHGVHMGEDLQNVFNTDPARGDFKDYTGVVFPANVRNCTACHVDDRFKTEPSQQACGACHDGTWFADNVTMPAGLKQHTGGIQSDDRRCTRCHPAETGSSSGKGIAEAHQVRQLLDQVLVSMTPPGNGRFYVPGETPKVTMVIKDDGGNPIDHTRVDVTNFSTAGLFVSGNRARTVPVLTSIAKNGSSKLRVSVSNSITVNAQTRGWTFAPGDSFKIAVNGNPPVVLPAPGGLQTPTQVRDWLAASLPGVTVTASATNVTIRSNVQGTSSRIDIYDSPVTAIMGWKPAGIRYSTGVTAGVTMEPYVNVAKASYPTNDLRAQTDPLEYADPAVTRSEDRITYDLADVAGLPPGTYSTYVWIQPVAGRTPNLTRAAIGFMNFQVGTAVEEKKVATNCTQCHGDTIWHLDEGPIHPEPFNPDYCKSCHDYARYETGDAFANQGGTSLNGWSGFGAVPLARRVHGVHFGRYLDHPEQIYAGNPDAFKEVIFPQDIRNCTKCHDPKESPAWKEAPSRLACNGCHDSDVANAHARAMTINANPADPWDANREETCKVCHGKDREFSADKVHNIADPYKPPYPREPED